MIPPETSFVKEFPQKFYFVKYVSLSLTQKDMVTPALRVLCPALLVTYDPRQDPDSAFLSSWCDVIITTCGAHPRPGT